MIHGKINGSNIVHVRFYENGEQAVEPTFDLPYFTFREAIARISSTEIFLFVLVLREAVQLKENKQ